MDDHHLYARLRRHHPGDGQTGRPLRPQAHLPHQHRALRCGLAVLRPRARLRQLRDAARGARGTGRGRRRHHARGNRGVRHGVPRGETRHGTRPRGRRVRHRERVRRLGRQPDPRHVRTAELAVHLLREHPHLPVHPRGRRARAQELQGARRAPHRRLGHRRAHRDGAEPAVRPAQPRLLRLRELHRLARRLPVSHRVRRAAAPVRARGAQPIPS